MSRITQRLIETGVSSLLALSLFACANSDTAAQHTQSEQAVMASTIFGASPTPAPGDGGYIPGPTGSGTGDGGTIPTGSGTGTATAGATSGSSTGSTSGTTTGTTGGTTAGATSGTATGSAATGTTTGGATSGSVTGASTGSSTGATSDGGNIPGTTGGASGDGGNIPGTTGGTSGTATGGTSGGTSSGATSGSVTGSATGASSGSTTGSTSGATGASTTGANTGTSGDGGNITGSATGGTSAGSSGTTTGSVSGTSGTATGATTGSSSGTATGATTGSSSGAATGATTGTSGDGGHITGSATGGTTGSTGGASGSATGAATGGTTGDCGCGGCTPSNPPITVTIGRVCSNRRSSDRSAEFFEEAHNPILSVEAIIPKWCGEWHPFQDFTRWITGGDGRKVAVSSMTVLKEISLHDVDLMKGRYKSTLNLGPADFQAAFGASWKKAEILVTVCDDTNHDGKCSDENANHILSVDPLSLTPQRLPRHWNLDVWNARGYNQDDDPKICDQQISPLVLDVTGEGIQLSGPENGVMFDINATGEPVPTGWIAGHGNGFLVRDVNGNGLVDDGSELFGTATLLKNGQRASSGFEALKELDDNGDGAITAADGAYSGLRIWMDKNFNGVSDKGEIFSLRRLGIDSIRLNTVQMNQTDGYGNTTKLRSTFDVMVKGQPSPRVILDVWFNTLVDAP